MQTVRRYLAVIGRKGGQAKTAAKTAAAIANGKLGGRPKKPKRKARRHNAGAERPATKSLLRHRRGQNE